FIDQDLDPNWVYYYILTAMDDAGLISLPSEPVAASPLAVTGEVDINNYLLQIVDGKAEITFQFPLNEVSEVLVYRIIDKGEPEVLYQISDGTLRVTDDVVQGREVRYFLQALFENGTSTG